MTEYPTSQEGPQPAAAAATPAPGGSELPSGSGPARADLARADLARAAALAASGAGTDEPGHGKAPVPAVEATRPGIPAARSRDAAALGADPAVRVTVEASRRPGSGLGAQDRAAGTGASGAEAVRSAGEPAGTQGAGTAPFDREPSGHEPSGAAPSGPAEDAAGARGAQGRDAEAARAAAAGSAREP
ncbi:hypothetical protein ACWD0E_23965, partial [Streptomyces sp. NPDC003002]